MNAFSAEQRRLIKIAIDSFSVVSSGTIGAGGTTGVLLMHTLEELRALSERSLPEIHLLSEATTVTSR